MPTHGHSMTERIPGMTSFRDWRDGIPDLTSEQDLNESLIKIP